ncbi:MAG TPA: DUF2238 domain-containing protein [Mollicutes bacterium]|nr:DUF2238 domain-containing protein [Mollicutes bacterium]
MKKSKATPLLKLNIAITILSIVICISYAILYLTKNDVFMMISSMLMILLPLFVFVLEKIIKTRIDETLKLSYLLFILGSGIFGAIGDFYSKVMFYDKLIHFTSGMFVTVISIILLERLYKTKINKREFFLLITVINIAVATTWEIVEFFFDLIFNKNAQKGNTDTMLDIITAIIGGFFISIPYIKNYIISGVNKRVISKG